MTVDDIKDYFGIPPYENAIRALDAKFMALTTRIQKLEEYKQASWNSYMEHCDSLRAKDLVIERDAYLDALRIIHRVCREYAPEVEEDGTEG